MPARRGWRSVPGHLAFVLAALVGAVTAVTSVYSYYYEGWGQGAAVAASFLGRAVLVVGVAVAAVRWPLVGGVVYLVGGVMGGAWWLHGQASTNGLDGIVVETAIVAFAPFLLIGSLFLLEGRHRRLLAAEGDPHPAGSRGTRLRAGLVVGLPLLAVLAGPARQLPELLARQDDGLRGARTIAGNGVTLTWAPKGPGWNQRGPDGAYLSSDALTQYGGSGAGLCGHLAEDGTRLLPEPARLWRLPTSDEVIRSLTRGGTTAGCTWDGRADHATCARPPDKETPLWAPDEAAIYYLTGDPAGARHVLGVNYTGGVTPHRRNAGVGYRCVKDALPASR